MIFLPLPGPQPGLASCLGASAGSGIPPKRHPDQKTLLRAAPVSTTFERLHVTPRDLQIIGRVAHSVSTNSRSPPLVQFVAASLSFSSVQANAIVSSRSPLGGLFPRRGFR